MESYTHLTEVGSVALTGGLGGGNLGSSASGGTTAEGDGDTGGSDLEVSISFRRLYNRPQHSTFGLYVTILSPLRKERKPTWWGETSFLILVIKIEPSLVGCIEIPWALVRPEYLCEWRLRRFPCMSATILG
jgi:hypothetical protein